MKRLNVILYIVAVIITALISYSTTYNAIISDFEKEAMAKEQLIWEQIEINTNFINMMSVHGTLFFEHGRKSDSPYYDALKYDAATNTFSLDSIENSDLINDLGNITGIGPIPKEGFAKEEIELALEFNVFFNRFFDQYQDVTWLYYTSDNNFINLFPWVASNEFKYETTAKDFPFFSVAIPQNNPNRIARWTPVYLDGAGKGLMVTLSEPIYANDKFIGVVSVDFTNDQLSSYLISQYDGYLIDPSGTVLASSTGELPDDQIINLKDIYSLTDLNFVKIMNLNHQDVARIGDRIVYSATFEKAPWRLIITANFWEIILMSMIPIAPITVIGVLLAIAFIQIESRKKTDILLNKERELFDTTLQTVNEGIIVTDVDGKIVLMNKAAEKMTGWNNEEAHGVEFGKVFNNLNLKTREPGKNPVKLVIEERIEGHSPKYIGLVSRDGSEYYITGTARGIYSKDDTVTGVVVSFRDATLEYNQESEIQAFIEINLDMLCVFDLEGRFVKVNKKFEEIMGYSSDELVNRKFTEFVHKMDLESSLKATEAIKSNTPVQGFTNRFRTKNGYFKYLEWYTQPTHNQYFYSSARDVTERFVSKMKLEKAALKDKLTGVFNRHYLDMIIEREMQLAEHNENSLSMVMVDLDYFKQVNDTWGHPKGDIVLKQTAQIISNGIRNSDILVRFGGEEFVILMPNTSKEGAIAASEKIRHEIENYNFPIEGKLTASFGVAEHIQNESFLAWYHRLDEALYRAKDGGRNRVSL